MDKNTLDGKDQWFFGGKLVHKILSCEPYVGRCKCFDCLSKEVFIFSHIQIQFSTFSANLARCKIIVWLPPRINSFRIISFGSICSANKIYAKNFDTVYTIQTALHC